MFQKYTMTPFILNKRLDIPLWQQYIYFLILPFLVCFGIIIFSIDQWKKRKRQELIDKQCSLVKQSINKTWNDDNERHNLSFKWVGDDSMLKTEIISFFRQNCQINLSSDSFTDDNGNVFYKDATSLWNTSAIIDSHEQRHKWIQEVLNALTNTKYLLYIISYNMSIDVSMDVAPILDQLKTQLREEMKKNIRQYVIYLVQYKIEKITNYIIETIETIT